MSRGILQEIIGKRTTKVGGSGAKQSSHSALASTSESRVLVTTQLNLQLGECAACGKTMYKTESDFSSMDGLGSSTTNHQVLHRDIGLAPFSIRSRSDVILYMILTI